MGSIWFSKPSLEDINARSKDTLMEALGIRVTRLGDDFIEGEMPVGPKTRQIYGILHGGASVALAESLGSLGAWLCVNPEVFDVVGVEINANHVRPVKDGLVVGRATPIHRGTTLHVWDIRVTLPDSDKLVSIHRLTVAVRKRAVRA